MGVIAAPMDPLITRRTAARCPPQLDFIEQVSQSWYLWFDELAEVDKADYTDPAAYLDALVAPLAADLRDPGFSYLTSITADEARFTSGAYIGFGFVTPSPTPISSFMIDVFEGSPAYEAGFRRGWELLAIDPGTGFETMAALRDRARPQRRSSARMRSV